MVGTALFAVGAPGLHGFLPAPASTYWPPYTTWAPTREVAAYVAGAPAASEPTSAPAG